MRPRSLRNKPYLWPLAICLFVVGCGQSQVQGGGSMHDTDLSPPNIENTGVAMSSGATGGTFGQGLAKGEGVASTAGGDSAIVFPNVVPPTDRGPIGEQGNLK